MAASAVANQFISRPRSREHKPLPRLTARQASLSPSAGHAVPTRRVLSARRVDMTDLMPTPPAPARSPHRRRPFSRPVPAPSRRAGPPKSSPPTALGRSHRSKLGKARLQLLHRPDARAAAAARHAPHRHRPGLRHRRVRDGDVDDARRAPGHHARLGELRRGLGDRRGQAAEARADRDPRRLRPAARPRRRSTGRTTCCSPGTAPPRACACPTATGSPTTARA